MIPDRAPNWSQAARAVVVARGREASVFAIGHVSGSEAWMRGALPLAVDERIKILLGDGGNPAVVTAKVVLSEVAPQHVVKVVFDEVPTRTRERLERWAATP